jgi:O-6-methylguanine DNA methyltransferase
MEAHFLRELRSAAFAPDTGKHARAHRELEQYFAGRLRRFTVKLHLFGTPFQMQVWTALRTIPHGGTTTYKNVADMIGNSMATRAVGGAVGKNPVPIIVPCHRVIGENGGLVGFGGGIERKKRLLQIEGALLV